MSNPVSEVGALPAAPPTYRGTAPKQVRPPVWPTVIGVISIILGVGGILSGIWAILMFNVFGQFMGTMPGGQTMTHDYGKLMLFTSVVAVLIAGLLLCAGIALVRRRRVAVPLHITWAIIKIVYAIGASIVGHFVQQVQLDAMNNDPQFAGAGTRAVGLGLGWFSVIGIIIGIAWYSVYPVFILIWFGAKRTSARERLK
ncbi:MAG TPA: hypothetical protein VG797_10275 [Phycisphaerales bacterium]|nr:hypothetical protein [Phycisphaerales bacterium]